MSEADTPPIKIEIVKSPSVAPRSFDEQSKYLRDIAKWITGGAVAAFATTALGASLSNTGALPISGEYAYRFYVAAAGLLLGALGISIILFFAINVFTIGLGSFSDVKEAGDRDQHYKLKKEVERVWQFEKNGWDWPDFECEPGSPFDGLKGNITSLLPFLFVRRRFIELQFALMIAGPITLAGIAVFAWASNPPEGFGQPAPTARTPYEVIEIEYDAEGREVRRTTTAHSDGG